MIDIPKQYNPKDVEKKIYKKWEESGFFNPDNCIKENITSSSMPPFSIVLPPPNVTGILHIGHASRVTTEDILIRFHRMKGYRTLWIPGTDHAAIATQSKVESIIYKEEKKNRHDIGREELLRRINIFAEESRNTIIDQIKKMGASLDWSREAYTLDAERSCAVVTAFKKLYKLGLIYRGLRVVNWDPKGQTTVSDDEVVHEETEGELYTFFYDKNFPIPIATTRPETKLGDTGVAVNPSDKRYKKYIGKEFTVNFVGEELTLKIVGDKAVDPAFGTGAVGLTPAHSVLDSEIASRHKLKMKQVINKYAKIEIKNPTFNNIKTKDARAIILEKLDKKNLLLKTEKIKQNISKAERTGGVIEPIPMLQWFIAVDKEFIFPHPSLSFVKKGEKTTLKKIMKNVVLKKEINIIPKRFEKIYFHWIDNLHDWCISRQIWFGHQVPVFYSDDNKVSVGEKPQEGKWRQDPDTLDTWFSSGLWTFSTMGWPQVKAKSGMPGPNNDLKNYHPTTVLETAYDILPFWVARMILMTITVFGDIPFKNVFIQGLVRDEKGRKMSKSLGNIIDPIDIADQYGTDALRMSLVTGSSPGTDTRSSIDKIKAQKHFSNKIWNAARFVLSVLPENKEELDNIVNNKIKLLPEEKKHEKELINHIKDITKDIDNFRLYMASEKIYHYFWHTFADKIIEASKEKINSGSSLERLSALQNVYNQLILQLKIIHPFMPFITEEIWSIIPKDKNCKNLLLVEPWPTS